MLLPHLEKQKPLHHFHYSPPKAPIPTTLLLLQYHPSLDLAEIIHHFKFFSLASYFCKNTYLAPVAHILSNSIIIHLEFNMYR